MMSSPTAPAAEIRLIDLEKRFGGVRAVDGVSLDVAAGEFFSLARAVRLRQDHDAADDRRLRAADRRPDPAARSRRHHGPARQAAGQHGLPELRPVPASRRRRERRLRAAAQARRQGRDHAARRRGARAGPPRRLRASASRTSCPAASSSGSRSPARSSTARTCCSSTSRSARSTSSSARQLQLELKRIQTEVGITFVYVTHDQEEALTMSDRIAVMHAGQVEQLGTPEELYERPATRFVADFIGTTNLLRGRRRGADGAGPPLARASACPIGATTGSPPGATVEISVRPESISLVPPDADRRRSAAAVDQAAYLGGNVAVPGPHGGRTHLSVLAPQDRAPPPGRQRRRRQPGRRPRPSSSAPVPHRRPRRSSHERPARRLARSTSRRALDPLHGRAADQPPRSCSSGSRRVGRGRGPRADHRGLRRGGPRRRRRPSAAPPPSAAATAARGRRRARRPPASSRRPSPRPEAELYVYNWDRYIGEDTVTKFEDEYGHQGQLRQVRRRRRRSYAKIRSDGKGGGYDVSLPDVGRRSRPSCRDGVDPAARPGLIPNVDNLGAGVAEPGLRPGQRSTRCRTCGGRPASAGTATRSRTT